jgi:cytochrome c553
MQRGAQSPGRCARGVTWPTARARSDGSFPVLAGQHASVVVKQLADIRSGLRDNPIMYPFATTLTDAQELADLAAYVSSLKSREANGRGPGRALELGQRLYERDCASCHGAKAEGDESKLFPLLAGQHYRYLLRQVTDIRSGSRRNANPEMVRRIRTYTTRDLEALADYTSRLQRPQRD